MKKTLLTIALLATQTQATPLEKEVSTYSACSNLSVEIKETIELFDSLKDNLDSNIDKMSEKEFVDGYTLLLKRNDLVNIKENISNARSCDSFIRSALIPKQNKLCSFKETESEWFTKRNWVCKKEHLGRASKLVDGETYELELTLDMTEMQKELISVDTNILSSTRKQIENAFYKEL